MDKIFRTITLKDLPTQEQDRGSCEQCGWVGDVSSCQIEQEGSFEEGYYDVYYDVYKCPACEDGYLTDFWYSSEEDG